MPLLYIFHPKSQECKIRFVDSHDFLPVFLVHNAEIPLQLAQNRSGQICKLVRPAPFPPGIKRNRPPFFWQKGPCPGPNPRNFRPSSIAFPDEPPHTPYGVPPHPGQFRYPRCQLTHTVLPSTGTAHEIGICRGKTVGEARRPPVRYHLTVMTQVGRIRNNFKCLRHASPCLQGVVLRAANQNLNDCRWQSYLDLWVGWGFAAGS